MAAGQVGQECLTWFVLAKAGCAGARNRIPRFWSRTIYALWVRPAAAQGHTAQGRGRIRSPEKKTFKDYLCTLGYEPGFLHVDIKYLPKMPDEGQRNYLGNRPALRPPCWALLYLCPYPPLEGASMQSSELFRQTRFS